MECPRIGSWGFPEKGFPRGAWEAGKMLMLAVPPCRVTPSGLTRPTVIRSRPSFSLGTPPSEGSSFQDCAPKLELGSERKTIARSGRAMERRRRAAEQRLRAMERRSRTTKKRPRSIARPLSTIARLSNAIDPASRAIARHPVQLPRHSMQSTEDLRQLHPGLGGLPSIPGNCTGMSDSCTGWLAERPVAREVARGRLFPRACVGTHIRLLPSQPGRN